MIRQIMQSVAAGVLGLALALAAPGPLPASAVTLESGGLVAGLNDTPVGAEALGELVFPGLTVRGFLAGENGATGDGDIDVFAFTASVPTVVRLSTIPPRVDPSRSSRSSTPRAGSWPRTTTPPSSVAARPESICSCSPRARAIPILPW